MSHFTFLNKEKTIANAKMALEKYSYWHNRELSQKVASLGSPIISDMPKAQSTTNTQENRILEHIDAGLYCEYCRKAIEFLTDERYQDILNNSYITRQYPDEFLMSKLCLSKTRFYQVKNEALLAFAQVCPPLPFKNDDDVYSLISYK
ncbi:hypothetical protein IV37_GL000172 [Fructilactobacillus fructivorans]|uniref:ArpU family phage packaging/lysis transcriptional regulator n=1 Tax=Fructilactobacillus fructivorans TaxID=1614 RepID=UPI0007055DA8|nr:ArpU family phage packaging/lysis transcriptional regulator [Fructilactobacillus fructivorans]KRN13450.1 hypothetical protein IV37_GL000172 [Fructilactobacillus fructivorans]